MSEVKRRYSSIRAATTTLRKNGYKPALSDEGPRTWKRAKNDKLEIVNIDLKESGVCVVK